MDVPHVNSVIQVNKGRGTVIIIIMSLIFVTGVLLWNTWSQQQRFFVYQNELVENSILHASSEITKTIETLRKRIKTFALQEKDLLIYLAKHPVESDAYKALLLKLKQEFPDAIATVLTNHDGDPYFHEFDGFVLDECNIDLGRFASSRNKPEVYIHPNPLAYHFDIITPVDLGLREQSIFFVSFSPGIFANILKENQLLGHQLLLLKKDNKKLIEVSARGSRDTIAEVNRYLTDKELERLLVSTPVKYTSWVMVDLPDKGYLSAENLQPWYEIIIIAGSIFFLVIYMYRKIELLERGVDQQSGVLYQQSMEIIKTKSLIEKERNQGIDLLERMTDAYLFVNARWTIEKANPQTDILFHINRFDIVGRNFWDIFPEVASSFYKNFRRAMDGQLITQFEGFYPPVNRWLAISLYPSESGMSIFFRDITDNKKHTDELKRREEQIRAIFDTSLEGILTIDEDGVIHSFNRRAEIIFGYKARDILGKPVTMLMPDEHAVKHSEYIKNYLRTGKSTLLGRKVEFKGVRQNNEQFPMELTVGEISTTEGRFFTGFVRDISQEKEALNARAVAEHASQAKSYFLANMSHEIRTPLMTILGFADSLLGMEQSEELRIDAIKSIISSGEHLLNLINDILDISKIEAGKLNVENIQFSPFKLLNEVEDIVSGLAKQKNLKFHIEYRFPYPEYIFSDYIRLKQILINLCSNAIKFTENGSIKVITEFDQNQRLICFYVIDTGIGLSEESRDKIFDLYTQAEESTTRKYGGTGLGLTLTKQLSLLLGGDITVDSELGRGSEFKVTLVSGIDDFHTIKLINSSEDIPEFDVSRKPVKFNKLNGRILLVEDNLNNQNLIKMILEKFGAEVTVADNGKEGVDLAKNNEFDLIYMDMQMPVMGGLEAITVLHKFGYKKPIVALTANALQEDREKCLNAGFNDFLSKPVLREQLYEMTKNYLKQDASQISNPIYSSLLEEDPNFADLVEKFLTSLKETKNRLVDAHENENWGIVQSIIHQLKGTGSSYGYPQLSEISFKIEKHLKSSNFQLSETLLWELYDVLDRAMQPISSDNSTGNVANK